MLTLGKFREATKDLGDEVQVSAAGAEVCFAWIEGQVLVLDEDNLARDDALLWRDDGAEKGIR
jgi:hypothetical protein